MSVVDVREMGVGVCHWRMPMWVGVRFLPVPIEIVDVLVMFVVPVPMAVLQRFMSVSVLVTLTKMQPDS